METRKKPARTYRLSAAEKNRIALLKATGASNCQIARDVGRDRGTIATALKEEEVEDFRKQARDVLTRAMPSLAYDFIEASRQGAKRGRHEPARDALIALRAIAPPNADAGGPKVVVILGGTNDEPPPPIEVIQTQPGDRRA